MTSRATQTNRGLRTTAETAVALGISIRTLQRMMANGDIVFTRSGSKAVYFQQSDIDAYLASRRSA